VGGGLLLLGQAALLPDALLWAASWAAGPGFGVGTGTHVTPAGSMSGGLPDLPLLTAVPATGRTPLPVLLACLTPLVAGAVAGAVVVRRGATRPRPDLAAATGAGAGAVAGALLGLLAGFAHGAAGIAHLRVVGPSPYAVALAAAAQLALVGAGTAWTLAHRRVRDSA